VTLAGACAENSERAGRQGIGRVDPARDRSLEVARGQMRAMDCTSFAVRLVDVKSRSEEMPRWSGAETLNSIAWLKRKNARGYDVSIRPDGQHGLVLLAGLDAAHLRDMSERGYRPAAVVELKRGHYQTWVKLAVKPVDDAMRWLAGASMARKFGNAAGCASLAEYGVLAGFTVHGSQLQEMQMAPYALLREAKSRVAPAAPAYLERMKKAMGKSLSQPAPIGITRHRFHGLSRLLLQNARCLKNLDKNWLRCQISYNGPQLVTSRKSKSLGIHLCAVVTSPFFQFFASPMH